MFGNDNSNKKRFDRMTVKETLDYYNDRAMDMQNSEKICYHENGNTYNIKSLNFDTFVRRVSRVRAVPIAIDDALKKGAVAL